MYLVEAKLLSHPRDLHQYHVTFDYLHVAIGHQIDYNSRLKKINSSKDFMQNAKL